MRHGPTDSTDGNIDDCEHPSTKRIVCPRRSILPFFILYPLSLILLAPGCGTFAGGENSNLASVSLVKVPRRHVEVRLAKGGLGSAGGLTNHGITHAKNGRWSDAVTTWKQALEADPDCHAAHFNLGQAYAIQGMHAWAYAAMRRATELDDDPLYRDGLRLVEVAMRPMHSPAAPR